ncbi:TPA: hypothetical protein ACF2D8_002344 [Serratia marcescens]
MIRTLTTEQLRALRDALKSWQDGYDPTDDKEQYEMFVTAETAVGELLANREAQPVEYGDAYQGAREDLSIWKRRALEAEDKMRHLEKINDHLVKEAQGEHRMGEPILTAPPAPAVNASPDFESWFVEKYKQPERLMKNEDGAYKFSGVQMAFSAWSDGRAAMLNVSFIGEGDMIQPQNIPNNIPDGLAAAVNRLLDCDGTRGHFSAIRCGDAREEVERLLAQPVSGGYTLNSPVIPDGWKPVPVEPTKEMINAALAAGCASIRSAYREMLAAAPEGGNG